MNLQKLHHKLGNSLFAFDKESKVKKGESGINCTSDNCLCSADKPFSCAISFESVSFFIPFLLNRTYHHD